MKIEISDFSYYFENLEEYKHGCLFRDINNVWEVMEKIKSYIDDIDNVNVYNEGIKEMKNGQNIVKIGKCIVDESTIIYPNVVIEGPSIIGKNCTIMPGAFIRPYTIIGDNCIVGHCAQVKNSIIMNNAKVQNFTFVGNSIIGDSARVGSGTILANRRFDQKSIKIINNNEAFDSGLHFFGCVLGDHARLGANCTTLPGTTIGKYTWISPMTKVKGFIEKEKMIDIKDCKMVIYDKQAVRLK
ncbi:MAG TPA: hypothetical protein DEP72_08090 [Clostridiales bacterium]|nr:MAG: hypothetical protein A2Y18_01215 [Clostridiales bacterium GWD2_32_19]HCC08096.1 hypothetical protein [Clostridiales bacterium]